MFNINKSMKRMLGPKVNIPKFNNNSKPLFIDNSLKNLMKPKTRNPMQNMIGDFDKDGVKNIMDCSIYNKRRHGGEAYWKVMRDKGINIGDPSPEYEDDEYYNEALKEEDDDEYVKKYEYRQKFPFATKREKKQIRRIFEKRPELLEQAKDTTIFVREPGDYEEQEKQDPNSQVQVISQQKPEAQTTEWYQEIGNLHNDFIDETELSRLKISPALLSRGIGEKKHSRKFSEEISKIPVRTEIGTKVEYKLEQDPFVDSKEEVLELVQPAGVVAHELEKRRKAYGVKSLDRHYEINSPPIPDDSVDPMYLKKIKEIQDKEHYKNSLIEEKYLTTEEINNLDMLQQQGKISEEERRKLVDDIIEDYEPTKIVYKDIKSKDTGERVSEALSTMGLVRDSTIPMVRRAFEKQYGPSEREKSKNVSEEDRFKSYREFDQKAPLKVKPIKGKNIEWPEPVLASEEEKNLIESISNQKMKYTDNNSYEGAGKEFQMRRIVDLYKSGIINKDEYIDALKKLNSSKHDIGKDWIHKEWYIKDLTSNYNNKLLDEKEYRNNVINELSNDPRNEESYDNDRALLNNKYVLNMYLKNYFLRNKLITKDQYNNFLIKLRNYKGDPDILRAKADYLMMLNTAKKHNTISDIELRRELDMLMSEDYLSSSYYHKKNTELRKKTGYNYQGWKGDEDDGYQ